MKPFHPSDHHPLRWLTLWRVLGWLLVIAVWILSLMPQTVSAPGGDKLHHFLAYFGLMLLFCQWYRRAQHPYLAIAFILMGCTIELIQPLTGRYFSWLDMLANVSGVLVAWWLAGGWPGQIVHRLETGRWL